MRISRHRAQDVQGITRRGVAWRGVFGWGRTQRGQTIQGTGHVGAIKDRGHKLQDPLELNQGSKKKSPDRVTDIEERKDSNERLDYLRALFHTIVQ